VAPRYHPKPVLTLREASVLAARLRGLTVKETAAELRISYHTTRHHIENIHRKFKSNSLQQTILQLQAKHCAKCRIGLFARLTKGMKIG